MQYFVTTMSNYKNVLTLLRMYIVLMHIQVIKPDCSIENARHEVVYSWSKTVDFLWPNKTFEREAKEKSRNRLGVPIGIKVFKEHIYMTLPRWSGNANIPANVVRTLRPETDHQNKIRRTTTPKLRHILHLFNVVAKY